MPGDNVEMVCDLVHDVAAEVGSRYVNIKTPYRRLLRIIFLSFTLREGGKTSEYFSYTLPREKVLIAF